MILEKGTVLNKIYKVARFVGSGNMGNVYLLERVRDGRNIVVEELVFPSERGKGRIYFKEVLSGNNPEAPILSDTYSFSGPEKKSPSFRYGPSDLFEDLGKFSSYGIKFIRNLFLPVFLFFTIFTVAGTMTGFLGEWPGLLITVLLASVILVMIIFTSSLNNGKYSKDLFHREKN